MVLVYSEEEIESSSLFTFFVTLFVVFVTELIKYLPIQRQLVVITLNKIPI